MINVENVTTAQVVRIPLVFLPGTSAPFVLRLTSIIDNELKAALTLAGTSLTSAYVTGSVELPADLPDGEYRYALRCGSDTLSCGLATVGNYKHTAQVYKQIIQFRQYDS